MSEDLSFVGALIPDYIDRTDLVIEAALDWRKQHPSELVWYVWSAPEYLMLEVFDRLEYYAVVCTRDGKWYKVPSVWKFVDAIRSIFRRKKCLTLHCF